VAEEQRWRGAWVRFWPLLAVVVVGLVLGCVLVFPRILYPPLTITELQVHGVRDPTQQVQLQNERLKLQNDARTTLLQGLGGLLVVSTAGAGAYTGWRQLQDNRRQQQRNEELTREQLRQTSDASQEQLRLTQEELRLTRESHITERFTRAVEQLGNDALDMRLGGIYALERIAKDSERDHPTVVEVLSAFVREGSRRPRTPSSAQGTAQATPNEPLQKPGRFIMAREREIRPRPPADVQAACTVLGRLPEQPNVSRGDLSDAQLAGAQLTGANLSGAWLGGADLSGAGLTGANLSGAWLTGANLSGARLNVANLSGAWLEEADLSGAVLVAAILSGAKLTAAILTQEQLNSALGDAKTRLPLGLRQPDKWATGEESAATSS
jgi:Pentapeptide repeats (8 copies)